MTEMRLFAGSELRVEQEDYTRNQDNLYFSFPLDSCLVLDTRFFRLVSVSSNSFS